MLILFQVPKTMLVLVEAFWTRHVLCLLRLTGLYSIMFATTSVDIQRISVIC